MSTVLYQGLQSCVESQLAASRTLRLKLASPKPNITQISESLSKPSSSLDSNLIKEESHSDKITKNPISSNPPNLGGNGWSFIQSLSSLTSSHPQYMEIENTYVHPLVKKSSSLLSEKSLEMCTENLGSETGTDSTESSIFSFSSMENDSEKFPLRKQPKSRDFGVKKFIPRSFPPPLSTMRGSDSIQCRPHREEGRLVINAFKTPLKETLFQVERSNGRLRLSFLKNNAPDFDSGAFVSQENARKSDVNQEELGREEEVEEDVCEDIVGNNTNNEVKMGMGNYQRVASRRCIEDRYGKNETLLKLNPFLMATS